MKKRTKKPKLKTLKKKVWEIFSKFIRTRDNGICFTCGKKDIISKRTAGHYIPKNECGLYLYFDERNVNCQCSRCNLYMHGNLSQYALALRRKYGNDILEKLDEDKNKHKGLEYTVEDYQLLITIFTKKLNEL